MWLCTKLGFFSVVQKHPDEFHVRARFRRDLVNLVDAWGDRHDEDLKAHGPAAHKWKTPKIHQTAPADYRYRIVLTAHQWAEVARVIFASIDYPNFKGVISVTDDQRAKLAAYTNFHHAMETMQNVAEFSRTRKRKVTNTPFSVIDGDDEPAIRPRTVAEILKRADQRRRRLIPGIEDATD